MAVVVASALGCGSGEGGSAGSAGAGQEHDSGTGGASSASTVGGASATGGSASEGGAPGSAGPDPQGTLFWQSGFENGFPGEWLNYENAGFPFTADGTSTGDPSNWTIIGAGEVPVPEGSHVYKAWVNGAASESHRPYPVLHTDAPSPLVNSFLVYIDLDYEELGGDWFHLATWANNEDWSVHTLSIRNRVLEMAHLDWEWIGPEPQPEFPLRQWVRFTAYIDYASDTETIRVWQDGVPILSGLYTSNSGTSLMRAHWGLYAPSTVSAGVHYNDDIQIRLLDTPLTDLETEP